MKTTTTTAGRVWALLTAACMKNGLGKSTYRLGLIGLGILSLSLLAALLPVAVSFAQALSFGSATNFPVAAGGWNPYAVAVGDVNGDGKLDLAVADNNGNTFGVVSIFLGNGDGSFGAATNFAAQGGPVSVAMGYLNSDTILDLAVVNHSSASVSVFFGIGDGSFSTATNYAVGSHPLSVAIGDLDGDGKADLAVANYDTNNVSILLNTGTGSFTAATNFAVGTSPQSVAMGDVNGDGKPDLAVANTGSHNVSILLNNGSGSFGAATNFAAASGPFSVAIGDLNADSKPDLAIVNDNNTNANVAILLNTGAGSFGAATYFGSDNQPSSVAISDFNGDGKSDLAVTSYFNNGVSILLGTGAGSFGSPANFGAGTGPRSVAVGDFNNDTRPDLAVANYWSNNVSILLNTCSQCTLPAISPVSLTRQEGSPSVNSTIANVNDTEDAENTLTLTVNGGSNAAVNGVTVSGINVDSAGVVTADVVAACNATTASFTLTVADPGGLSTTATLTVTLTGNTPPTLGTYPNASVNGSGNMTVTPNPPPNPLPSDNGSIASITATSPSFTGGLSANSATGVVTISNAGPGGDHLVTVTATDNCGAMTSTSFTLNVTCAMNPSIVGVPTVVANIPVGSTPYGVAVNATTNRIYVANRYSDSVSVIDGNANAVVATAAVGSQPHSIALNAQTNRIYTANYNAGTISVISGATNTVSATVTGLWTPVGVGVNPITNRIYGANIFGSSVSAINGDTNTITADIPVVFGSNPWGVAANPQTNRIYVTNQASNTVTVINGDTNTIITTIPVGSNPIGVAVNPQTNRIYVTNQSSGTVSVIDGNSNTVVASITVGSNPIGVAVNPQTNRAFVVVSGANTVAEIDGTTNAVVQSIVAGTNLWGVDVNPQTNRVYVTNQGPHSQVPGTVSVIAWPPPNTPPTISRQQGSPSLNSPIAKINGGGNAMNTLLVKVNGGASDTVNGVTVSGISVDSAGVVTADVVAACNATTASFTLTVADPGCSPTAATLTVNVTANTPPTLTYNNQAVAAAGSLTINPATGPSDNGSVSSIAVQNTGTYTGTISVNSSGVISASNAAPVGSHTITIRATDNCGEMTDVTFTLNVACANLIVSNNADSGAGSLRQAIANACVGGAITFANTVTSPITLASELVINKNLTIHGPGANLLSISGNNASRVFAVATATVAVLDGLTVTSGNGMGADGTGNGSAIVNRGTLTVSNCIVSNSTAVYYGGGLYNYGTLTLNNCTVSGNVAGYTGGGLFSVNTVTVINSTLTGNQNYNFVGGGMYVSGTATVTNTTFSNNQSGAGGGHGGGVYVDTGGTAMFSDCTFTGNIAGFGAGLANAGTVTLTNSKVANNTVTGSGGGLFNTNMLTVTNSTLSNNQTGNFVGAGLYTSATAVLTNTTISNNQAGGGGLRGGGIFIDTGGAVTLTYCTITGNAASAGGGIYNLSTLSAKNSIIAKNTITVAAPDVFGPLTSQGFNLIGNSSGATIAAQASDQIGTAAMPIDPLLGALADNGGPTQTHALLFGSPALDKGSAATDITTDQRGLARPIDLSSIADAAGGNGSDIGAFETQTVATPAGTNVTVQSDAVALTFPTVSTAGVTTVMPINPSAAGTLPGGYQLGNLAYEISTTASITPPITLCFSVPSVTDPTVFASLRILHNEGGMLVDRTILSGPQAPNFTAKTICASVSSLSPFAVAVKLNDPPVLSYASSQTVLGGQTSTINPASGPSASNSSVASIVVQNVTPALGSALTVNNTTGVVTVSNTAPPGTYAVTIRITDNNGTMTDATFTLNILNACGITVNPATLPSATLGVPFVQVLSASPTGSYTFSLSAGTLPPGVTLVKVLGIYSLRGTPTTRGTYNFTIKAKKNNTTCESIRNYTMTIP